MEAHREVARRLLGEAVIACRSTEAAIWLLVKEGDHLVAFANVGQAAERLEGLLVPVAGSLVGLVLGSGQPTVLGPDAPYHPAAAAVTGLRTEAMAVSPVRCHGKVIGVVSTINPTDRTLFGPEDLEALQWTAFLMGCALEHLGWDRDTLSASSPG